MTIKVAVNGLGRIGRCITRAIFEHPELYKDIELVAVNGPAAADVQKHLLKYDSIHGRFSKTVEVGNGSLVIDGQDVKLFHERDPRNLPWKELGVDIVFECTGIFTKHEDASKHIEAGARKVIISAPSKDKADAPKKIKTIVFGVNNQDITANDDIISVGSCTTNCLAPVAKVLNDKFEIISGFMTTIHSYTNDQNVVDGSHKDLRRARACAMSMIPTSTGAAKAISLVLPELTGKLDGGAIRVPTANVSMVDLNFVAGKSVSAEEINKVIKEASENELKGVLGYFDEPLVSIDFNHTTYSSAFDSLQTKTNGNLVKIASWYDNEWAFSLRMLDIAKITV